jgi:hypothetical protein
MCPLSSNELFELGPNDIALGAAMKCEQYIHACIQSELTVRTGALVDGRRAPDRVTFRPQAGSAARELLLLDLVEELLLALHQELFDTEVLDRVVRREGLQLLRELVGDTTVRIGELKPIVRTIRRIEYTMTHTEATALFRGELDFSSTIEEMDSTEETRE